MLKSAKFPSTKIIWYIIGVTFQKGDNCSYFFLNFWIQLISLPVKPVGLPCWYLLKIYGYMYGLLLLLNNNLPADQVVKALPTMQPPGSVPDINNWDGMCSSGHTGWVCLGIPVSLHSKTTEAPICLSEKKYLISCYTLHFNCCIITKV